MNGNRTRRTSNETTTASAARAAAATSSDDTSSERKSSCGKGHVFFPLPPLFFFGVCFAREKRKIFARVFFSSSIFLFRFLPIDARSRKRFFLFSHPSLCFFFSFFLNVFFFFFFFFFFFLRASSRVHQRQKTPLIKFKNSSLFLPRGIHTKFSKKGRSE